MNERDVRTRGSIDVYGSRSVHCARKRCHTPASIAVTIVGRRRRLEHLPQVMEQRARGRALIDAKWKQPFKAMAARSWANESGTLLDFDAATTQAPRGQSLRVSCQQHSCAVRHGGQWSPLRRWRLRQGAQSRPNDLSVHRNRQPRLWRRYR